ncbi:MAG: GntR family transcriptional regulator [Pseudomonadota bacterium]|nr:GntR family transcriptional regulator [Pseudomonadota bacterium]
MSHAQKIFVPNRFDLNGSAPLYARLKNLVQQSIENGELKEGDAVPAERDVAEMLSISRVTVRKAFTELVMEGVLVQRRGSGTYVNGPGRRIEQPLSRLTSFTQDMQLRGIKTDADWLSRVSGLPTPDEALKLSISPSEQVSRFRRLRRADGIPLAIENAVIPNKFLPDPEQVEGSLYAALDARGLKPVRALQRLHASALSAMDAKLLDLPTGSPALFIERISYLGDGRAVEYTRSCYRGDSYDFLAELTIAPEVKS